MNEEREKGNIADDDGTDSEKQDIPHPLHKQRRSLSHAPCLGSWQASESAVESTKGRDLIKTVSRDFLFFSVPALCRLFTKEENYPILCAENFSLVLSSYHKGHRVSLKLP